MNLFLRTFSIIGLSALTSQAFAHGKHAHDSQEEFFETLSGLCGQSFAGKTVYPDDPDHDFAGKKLIMTVADCSDVEIRIPFQVGNDTSRTWVISHAHEGLLFKHDHRHPDGTPDEVTNYGGYADKTGSAFEQSFPADAETAELIPAAKTNVWSMTIDPTNKIFTYYLERNNKPRYQAEFNLADNLNK